MITNLLFYIYLALGILSALLGFGCFVGFIWEEILTGKGQNEHPRYWSVSGRRGKGKP